MVERDRTKIIFIFNDSSERFLMSYLPPFLIGFLLTSSKCINAGNLRLGKGHQGSNNDL